MAKDLVNLMIDTYKGSVTEYSSKEANEVIRKALLDVAGLPADGKVDYKTFRKHKVEFFEIIEEALTELVQEGLEKQFEQFAEIRNINWGDSKVFTVEDRELFKVAVIADGNGNLRRQRIDRGEFTVDVSTRGVKIYEELYRLLAGRVDWNAMVDRVARSYNNEIATQVYNALYNSFDQLTATYAVSAAYTEATLTSLAQHVEASTGANVVIYGTKASLSKVAPSVVSDNMRDKRNIEGFYGVVNGYELREIKQAHVPGTDNFAINDSFLLVVPNLNDKMVKIVVEGDAIIQEQAGGQTADMSQEYTFIMKSGIAVVPSSNYGIYRLA
jgi:hypothetical protein